MRTPPSLADFTHARACKPFCEKSLTLPCHTSALVLIITHFWAALMITMEPGGITRIRVDNQNIVALQSRWATERRNRWMLGQADPVVAYATCGGGGAAKFRGRAFRQGKAVIDLGGCRNKQRALKPIGFKALSGGDKRDRTADLLNAIQALSQLSYTPRFCAAVSRPLRYYSKQQFSCQVLLKRKWKCIS